MKQKSVKPFLMKKVAIAPVAYLIISVTYLVLSYKLNSFVSGGWDTVLIIGLSFFAYVTFFLIMTGELIIRNIKSSSKVNLPLNYFLTLVLPFQIFFLLFYTGDCGDSPCGIGFDPNGLRRLIIPRGNLLLFQQFRTVAFLSFLAYFAFLFIFMIISITKTKNQELSKS
jgi:hypothetical protein